MAFGTAEYTNEQIKEIKEAFKKNDITDGYPLKPEIDLPPDKADIFNRTKRIFAQYWKDNLKDLGINQSMKNYSKDHPVNFLMNVDGKILSEVIAELYDQLNVESDVDFIDTFCGMYQKPLMIGVEGYAKKLGKAPDDLADEELMFVIDKVAGIIIEETLKDVIHAKDIDISIYTNDFQNEYISLTDIARFKSDEPSAVIQNWMRSRGVIEFLGLWESLNNPDFKPIEFEGFKNEAGANAFTMSPKKWIEGVNAVGIVSKSGRYGGTFAHSDIAFEFASWISAEFKLYIIQDYKRLKTDENSRLSLNWNLNREIARLNYRIHTDAIKEYLIPADLTPSQISFKYADEADLLNTALFGMTAKEWRDKNPDKKGNIRDYATINQLLVLANAESYNSVLIGEGKPQSERLVLIRNAIVKQMKAIGEINIENIKLTD